MAKEENNNNFALIALVAIVAVVGLVSMIMMQGGTNKAPTEPAYTTVTQNENLAGNALYSRTVSSLSAASDCGGLKYSSCRYRTDCSWDGNACIAK